jgi:hypothetical protein
MKLGNVIADVEGTVLKQAGADDVEGGVEDTGAVIGSKLRRVHGGRRWGGIAVCQRVASDRLEASRDGHQVKHAIKTRAALRNVRVSLSVSIMGMIYGIGGSARCDPATALCRKRTRTTSQHLKSQSKLNQIRALIQS